MKKANVTIKDIAVTVGIEQTVGRHEIDIRET